MSPIHQAGGVRYQLLEGLVVPMASSGPMEKAVDLVVARRFRLRGMSWIRRGVGHLVHLRLLRLDGTWARYWGDRLAALRHPWPSAA